MSRGGGVLITGAGGYLGRQVVEALAQPEQPPSPLVALDIRLPAPDERLAGVDYRQGDIRQPGLEEHLAGVDTVVHLAAVVTPGKEADREFLYSVEVAGTQNLLQACLAAGVKRFIYTSSGAAYGYHPDNPQPLEEHHPLRGNPEFAYSHHKRLVEEMLARWRDEHPELEQLVFRPGTILGASTNNQITALFEKRVVLGIAGSPSPFVFIWDQDVVGAILKGIREGGSGIYNLAGDGTLTMPQIAEILGRPYLPLPAGLVAGALWLLQKLGLTRYGPEQVGFLRYRPVLSNRRLKEKFGYIPAKTTRQVFDYFLEHRRRGS